MEIYPSFLSATAPELLQLILQAQHVFDHVQIDIADGTYTQSSTCTIPDIIQACSDSNFTTTCTAEIHLMVEDIEHHIKQLTELSTHIPITEVIVHLEPAIRWTRGHEDHLHELLHAHFPFAMGVAISPEVRVREHMSTLIFFETIQIMTVQPGAQGNPFLPNMLKKITHLRELGYNGRIVLDGGISDITLPTVLNEKLWPDAICPGSYFSKQPDEMRTRMEALYAQLISAEERDLESKTVHHV